MNAPVVVVGLGQMGAAFAHGFLRCGHPVYPVTRATDPAEVARAAPEPALVLVAVGEADLPEALATLPDAFRDRVALLQNELVPHDWEAAGITRPSVAVVWFEKKRDKPIHPILPTPVAGPSAGLLHRALEAIDVPAREVDDDALLFELVKKNLYILTTNLAGLETGGTVSELWNEHGDLARDVAAEVIAIEAWRTGHTLPGPALLQGLAEAIAADPTHGCTGRSAPQRLRRALDRAGRAELHLPTLERLARRYLS